MRILAIQTRDELLFSSSRLKSSRCMTHNEHIAGDRRFDVEKISALMTLACEAPWVLLARVFARIFMGVIFFDDKYNT